MSGGDPDFRLRARAVSEELFRVLSNEPATRGSAALEPVLVSFAGRPDALEFLRTVPTGTSRADLERLGAAYCAAHPAPPVAEQDDSSDA
jgi:hypothetical protein